MIFGYKDWSKVIFFFYFNPGCAFLNFMTYKSCTDSMEQLNDTNPFDEIAQPLVIKPSDMELNSGNLLNHINYSILLFCFVLKLKNLKRNYTCQDFLKIWLKMISLNFSNHMVKLWRAVCWKIETGLVNVIGWLF